jgi:hypothetical protein
MGDFLAAFIAERTSKIVSAVGTGLLRSHMEVFGNGAQFRII